MEDSESLIRERLRKDRRHRAFIKGILIIWTSVLMFIAIGFYA